MITATRDAAKTALNGFFMIAVVFCSLAAGPHVELAIAPPVAVWEIQRPRIEGAELRWAVVVDQRRRCTPTVSWSLNGSPLLASGPSLALAPGAAGEVGPFVAPIITGITGGRLSATVIYNCGLPWGLAPIRKTVHVE